MKKLFCLYCNKDISNENSGNHHRWCLSNPNRRHRKIKVCPECKNMHSNRGKYCGSECVKLQCQKPERKQKLSETRKTFLACNPEKHPWKKNTKFKSIPCEKLKDYLRSKSISFVEEWQPLSDRYFSIDIAFPDIKLGIEINGNQHYCADGSLNDYYQERHDLIEAEGWKLIELHYSSCFNFELIESLIQIKEQPDYSEYFKLKEEKRKKQETLPRGQKQKRKSDIKWEPYKEIVLNSNIDFAKFGWVKQVAKILMIKDQKVNKWMKRYLPDFYDQYCFKKNNAGVSHRSSKPTLIE